MFSSAVTFCMFVVCVLSMLLPDACIPLYLQVGTFWNKVLKPEEQQRLVENIAGHLKDAQPFIQERAVANFAKADPEYGRRIKELLDKYRK